MAQYQQLMKNPEIRHTVRFNVSHQMLNGLQLFKCDVSISTNTIDTKLKCSIAPATWMIKSIELYFIKYIRRDTQKQLKKKFSIKNLVFQCT